jgi:hypothetical protein
VPGLYRELYRGFTVKHFHEQLGKRHDYTLGDTVTQLHLHRSGLVTPAKMRSAHRKKRPLRPMVGMDAAPGCLDARLAAWGRRQAGRGGNDGGRHRRAVFGLPGGGERHGVEPARGTGGGGAAWLFCSLYTDRGSHYFETPEAGGRFRRRC